MTKKQNAVGFRVKLNNHFFLTTTSAEGNAFPKEGHGNKSFISQNKGSCQLQGISATGIRKFGAGHGNQDHFRLFSAGTEIKFIVGRPARKWCR
jgi:hypothetical protein